MGIENKNFFASQTSLLVRCKKNYTEDTIKDICNSVQFSTTMQAYMESHSDNIIYITIFPNKDNEKVFEKTKFDFIEILKDIVEYISIIYDSQTIDYMQEISKTVYFLEREFRTLIEIVFLVKYGSTWYDQYFKDPDKEHDRKTGRSKVISLLDNPLDNRDFVVLKNFVEERIKFSKNTAAEKLYDIENLLEEFSPDKQDSSEILGQILNTIQDLKKISDFKRTGTGVSNLFSHITADLADEWQALYYSHRNPWAHNHCIMTRDELEKYQQLSSSVLHKIRTEITLIGLLNKEKEFCISGPKISLTMVNFSKSGSSTCKLKLKLHVEDNQYLLDIADATYVEIFEILEIISNSIKTINQQPDIDLDYLKLNPFLKTCIKHYASTLFKSKELDDNLSQNFPKLEKALATASNDRYTLKKGEGTSAIMKEDVDEFLKNIFS
ncbi:hypothetical protein ORM77_16130 [Bacillus cereus]|uniref:hypothetical protein n=1 Tax=Bacillus cereus TaxID=1396 RepID=UPI002ABF1966|nr:hypothetical protein [Bacillus cereus]MDZ4619397.1 hypothetical protein [Bacillus cereus]